MYIYITSGVRGMRALALRTIKRWVQENICAELLYVVAWLCDHIDNVLMYACIAMQVVVLRATPVELQGSLTWILRIVWRMRERARDSIAQNLPDPGASAPGVPVCLKWSGIAGLCGYRFAHLAFFAFLVEASRIGRACLHKIRTASISSDKRSSNI